MCYFSGFFLPLCYFVHVSPPLLTSLQGSQDSPIVTPLRSTALVIHVSILFASNYRCLSGEGCSLMNYRPWTHTPSWTEHEPDQGCSVILCHRQGQSVKGSNTSETIASHSHFCHHPLLLLLVSICHSCTGYVSIDHRSTCVWWLQDIDGNDVELSTFKGKVLLIVNVASQWYVYTFHSHG